MGKEKGPVHLGRGIVKKPDAAGGDDQGGAKAHQLNQPRFHQGALNGLPAVFGGMHGNGLLRPGKRLLGDQLFPVAKKLMAAFAAIHHGTLRSGRNIDMSFALWTIQIHRSSICTFLILLQYLSFKLSFCRLFCINFQGCPIELQLSRFPEPSCSTSFFLNFKFNLGILHLKYSITDNHSSEP